MSAVSAVVASFILLDFPSNTQRLSEPEHKLAVMRILDEGSTVAEEDRSGLGHIEAFNLALKNWRTWAFAVGYMVNHLFPYFLESGGWLTCEDWIGDCWFFHSHIFLSNSCEMIRLYLHSSPIHDGPHLCHGLRLHSHKRILHRSSRPSSRTCNHHLARHFRSVLDNHSSCIQLHLPLCLTCNHGIWSLDH